MCGLEFPDIERRIWQRYRDRGVVVLGISGDGLFGTESTETLTNFVEQTNVTFPIVRGDESRREYGDPGGRISPFPFDVIIDQRGKIRHVSAKFDAARMVEVIENLLEPTE